MAHTLPPLPYDYGALEPHIDARTMEIHHTKHHQGYVNNLNAALEKVPNLQGKSLEDLLGNLDAVPENARTAVRNNGGGHWNHSMFWQIMGPNVGSEPSGALADAIKSSFGGFDQFKEKFAAAATGRSTATACRSTARLTRIRPSCRASARSSASTCGSTPTTSSIRTGGPTTLARGGT